AIEGAGYDATDRRLDLAAGSGGALAITDAGNTFHWRGDISGNGPLAVQGPGTLLLDHANAYSGGTTVQGTLQLGANGAIGSGALVLDDGSRLALRAADARLDNAVVING